MHSLALKRTNHSPRRREILDAALRCFLQNGFHSTTIEQIRDGSGASHGSIYHHFGSKEGIALALYEEGLHDYQQAIFQALSNTKTLRDGVRAVVTAHLGWTANDPARSIYLTRVGSADVAGNTAQRIAAVNQEFFDAINVWLEPFVARCEIIRVVPELYVPLILGPAANLCRHWLSGRIQGELLNFAKDLADAAWESVRIRK